MNEEDEALDFILKVQQENMKNLLEDFKQLEYKAYINATLSMGILVALLTVINNANYLVEDAKKAVVSVLFILSVSTILILVFSAISLFWFTIAHFLNVEYAISYFYNINIKDSLPLKKSLLSEILKNSNESFKLHTNKQKYLNYGSYLLFFELFLILGIIIGMSLLWFSRLSG